MVAYKPLFNNARVFQQSNAFLLPKRSPCFLCETKGWSEEKKRGRKRTVPAERPGLGRWKAGRSALPTRAQCNGSSSSAAHPGSPRGACAAQQIRRSRSGQRGRRTCAKTAAVVPWRRENRVQCDCAKAGKARGGREGVRSAPARGLRGAVAGPGGVEWVALRVRPSAALVSFAELGGAEEDEEVVAGSDAARLVGAPLSCLFIYLSIVCASECARSTTWWGGVGGGPGEKGGPETGVETRVTCRWGNAEPSPQPPLPWSPCSRCREGASAADKMADGELNVDSLITRLLEGECRARRPAAGVGGTSLSPHSSSVAETRGGPLSRPGVPAREGAKGWLDVGRQGERGWPRGRRGRARRAVSSQTWGDCYGDSPVWGCKEPRGAGWASPRRVPGCVLLCIVMSMERVFLFCSLCALPLAASRFLFREWILSKPWDDCLISSAFLYDAVGRTLFKKRVIAGVEYLPFIILVKKELKSLWSSWRCTQEVWNM